MSQIVRRGALIVVEGLDKTGKTTQCAKLLNRLTSDGNTIKLFNFPDRKTEIGKLINEYLQRKTELDDHVIHLLFSANRWEAVATMKKLLLDGCTLIVDRYAYSGVAFSAAKKGMDFNWCMQPDIGLPKPDAVIYLTRDVSTAAESDSYGEERYENLKFQANVAEMYDRLKSSEWKIVDIKNRSIDDVNNELHSIVENVMKEVGDKDIGELWTEFQATVNA